MLVLTNGRRAAAAMLGLHMPFLQRHVFVCTNERPADNPKGSCARCGGAAVRDALKAALAERGLNKQIRANNAGCLDQCAAGVAMVVYPEQVWYGHVTVEDIAEIVDKHLVGGVNRIDAHKLGFRNCGHEQFAGQGVLNPPSLFAQVL